MHGGSAFARRGCGAANSAALAPIAQDNTVKARTLPPASARILFMDVPLQTTMKQVAGQILRQLMGKSRASGQFSRSLLQARLDGEWPRSWGPSGGPALPFRPLTLVSAVLAPKTREDQPSVRPENLVRSGLVRPESRVLSGAMLTILHLIGRCVVCSLSVGGFDPAKKVPVRQTSSKR
jgi:hypothetical protein